MSNYEPLGNSKLLGALAAEDREYVFEDVTSHLC